MYDVRFKNPSSFLLAGASQSGKTTFTFNLLRNIHLLFEKPECRQHVIYFYNQEQDGFELFAKEEIVHAWVNALPSLAEIESRTARFKSTGGCVVVIDDFADEVNKETLTMFTQKCHHNNFVLILLSQNIFCQNPWFRPISLNSTYVVMFKNPRDASQISCFAKQFAPGGVSWVVNAFRDATRRPHSYLLFDSHQQTPDVLRIRSNIMPHELPVRVYMEKSSTPGNVHIQQPPLPPVEEEQREE